MSPSQRGRKRLEHSVCDRDRPELNLVVVLQDSGLLLRVVQPGEQRLLGTLDAIDCVNGTVVLRVTSNGRTVALRARQFADVDFISHRSSTPSQMNCGPQKSRERVYATYRPDAAAGGIDGLAVAIELLPDDFVPPNPPR